MTRIEALINSADKRLKNMEDNAIAELNKALDRAFNVMERKFNRVYGEALKAESVTPTLRTKLIMDQLGELLSLVSPDTREFYEGRIKALVVTAQQIGIDLSFDMTRVYEQDIVTTGVNLEAASFASQNSFDRLQNHSEAFRLQAINIIGYNLLIGSSARKTAGELQKALGVTKSRAEMIARTETIAALNEAAEDFYATNNINYVQVFATADDRTCRFCGARNQRIYKLRDIRIPLHPHCFPAGTVVEGLKAKSATRRYYVGEMLTIKTAFGKELTVTPNHPILTPNGWVSAGKLIEGNHVFSTSTSEGVRDLVDPDSYQTPTLIEEVFTSLRESLGVSPFSMEVTPEDFHGDFGGGGKVDIILSDRFLRNGAYSEIAEPLTHEYFSGRSGSTFSFSPLSFPTLLFPSESFTSKRLVCASCLSDPSLSTHPRPFDDFSLAASSRLNTGIYQRSINGFSTDSQLFRDSIDRYARIETFNNRSSINYLSVIPSNRDIKEFQSLSESLRLDTQLLRKIFQAPSSQVFLDQIILINRFSYKGHIYNLETSEQWYTANNIIVHNCRCYLSPARPDWWERGLLDKKWMEEYAAEVEVDRDEGLAPFERAAGRKNPPLAVWKPGELFPDL